jgi:hypothetical protein
MTVKRKSSSYRIDQSSDGCFDVVRTDSGEPDSVVSRHLTRDAARGWLVNHLRMINMDNMTDGTRERTP